MGAVTPLLLIERFNRVTLPLALLTNTCAAAP
jgi:hypothetical protein